MRDIAGWDSDEVCSTLDISEVNQRVLLHRARWKVRLALEGDLGRMRGEADRRPHVRGGRRAGDVVPGRRAGEEATRSASSTTSRSARAASATSTKCARRPAPPGPCVARAPPPLAQPAGGRPGLAPDDRVSALKCLRTGAIGPFSGFRWPTPSDGPGQWVAASPSPCASGVHACLRRQLPLWLHDELWEIELGGAVTTLERKVVAARGRLVRRDRGVGRARARRTTGRRASTGSMTLAAERAEVRGYAEDGRVILAQDEPLVVALAAARAAEVVAGPEAYEGGEGLAGRPARGAARPGHRLDRMECPAPRS